MLQAIRVIIFALIFFAFPALAKERCYHEPELIAEQLLRLHSELMVITLTCHQASDGQDLVPAYTAFTKLNIDALHNAEQTLIAYYGGKAKKDRLDKLRTRLGNEYGQKIADISAPHFCDLYRDKVVSFYTYNPDQVRQEAERMAASEKSYGHLCATGTKSAKATTTQPQ